MAGDTVEGMSPRLLFRLFAFAELITWAGLITALILRGTGVSDAWVTPAGGVHGFVFLAYCVVTVLVWIDARWHLSWGALGLASAVIPFATLPFELSVDRRGMRPARGRLAPAGERPRGWWEHVLAWVLRRPWLALLLLAVAVTAVFLLLLWVGPPVPKS
jgi:integral membrane protein